MYHGTKSTREAHGGGLATYVKDGNGKFSFVQWNQKLNLPEICDYWSVTTDGVSLCGF